MRTEKSVKKEKHFYLLLQHNSWRNTDSLCGPGYAESISGLDDLSTRGIPIENCYRSRASAERYAKKFNAGAAKAGAFTSMTVIRVNHSSKEEVAERIRSLESRLSKEGVTGIKRYSISNLIESAKKAPLPRAEDILDDAEKRF